MKKKKKKFSYLVTDQSDKGEQRPVLKETQKVNLKRCTDCEQLKAVFYRGDICSECAKYYPF